MQENWAFTSNCVNGLVFLYITPVSFCILHEGKHSLCYNATAATGTAPSASQGLVPLLLHCLAYSFLSIYHYTLTLRKPPILYLMPIMLHISHVCSYSVHFPQTH